MKNYIFHNFDFFNIVQIMQDLIKTPAQLPTRGRYLITIKRKLHSHNMY